MTAVSAPQAELLKVLAPWQAIDITPEISIVIPAFNEELRLPLTLDLLERHLTAIGVPAEVIVVDDGSHDRTAQVVRDRAASWPELTLLTAARNGGKGEAVRIGMAAARGRYRIFSDADLSVPIDDMEKLLGPLRAGAGVAIASRGLLDSQVEVRQPWYRETMGRTFNRLVRIFALSGVHDSQCGFKAFTAEVADRVFRELQTRGFGFDVEVLYRAQQAGYQIVEVPTRWINSPQSHVHPIRHSTMMLLELLAIPRRVRRHPTPKAVTVRGASPAELSSSRI
jgi:dolichyl-phosphate beta-glucosyltransferase